MAEARLQQILVPLDGSLEAECVLPYLRDLAPRFNAKVHVLAVGIGQRTRRVNRLLEDYIVKMAEELKRQDINAEASVVYGTTADMILEFAQHQKVDLILMATHGLSGVTRWWLGSVAEKVVSASPTPIMLVQATRSEKHDATSKKSIERILVPLDGSELGQAALPYAEMLAFKTGAALDLLHVVAPPGAIEASLLTGPDWVKLIQVLQKAGEDYLKEMVRQLGERGIKASYEVVTGEPADKIVQYAEAKRVSLIAMSTHGRTGLARWVMGSIADKVVHSASMPVWLVRSAKILAPKAKP